MAAWGVGWWWWGVQHEATYGDRVGIWRAVHVSLHTCMGSSGCRNALLLKYWLRSRKAVGADENPYQTQIFFVHKTLFAYL